MKRTLRRLSLPALILSQPFEFCISFSLALIGIQSIRTTDSLSGFVDDALGSALVTFWQFGIIASSVTILASFVMSTAAIRRGEAAKAINRMLEQIGLVLMAMSAFAYAVVLAITSDGLDRALFAVGIMGGIVAACILRIIALQRLDRATLRHLKVVIETLD